MSCRANSGPTPLARQGCVACAGMPPPSSTGSALTFPVAIALRACFRAGKQMTPVGSGMTPRWARTFAGKEADGEMRRNSDAPKGVKRARVELSQPTTRRTPCTAGTAVGKIRVGIFVEWDGGGRKTGDKLRGAPTQKWFRPLSTLFSRRARCSKNRKLCLSPEQPTKHHHAWYLPLLHHFLAAQAATASVSYYKAAAATPISTRQPTKPRNLVLRARRTKRFHLHCCSPFF
jgi:hypothetical protein